MYEKDNSEKKKNKQQKTKPFQGVQRIKLIHNRKTRKCNEKNTSLERKKARNRRDN